MTNQNIKLEYSADVQRIIRESQATAMPVVEDAFSIARSHAWHVVLTFAKTEQKVVEACNQAGFRTCAPTLHYFAEQRHADKRAGKPPRRISRNLLPGYVLVRLPVDGCGRSPFGRLSIINEVYDFLRFGAEQEPVSIREAIVKELMARDARGDFDLTKAKYVGKISNEQQVANITTHACFNRGQQAVIADGPMAGFVATISRVVGRDIVEADIIMLGGKTKVRLQAAQLKTG